MSADGSSTPDSGRRSVGQFCSPGEVVSGVVAFLKIDFLSFIVNLNEEDIQRRHKREHTCKAMWLAPDRNSYCLGSIVVKGGRTLSKPPSDAANTSKAT